VPHLHSSSPRSVTRRRFAGTAGSATVAFLLAGCDRSDSVSNSPDIAPEGDIAMDSEPMFAAFEPADEPDGDPAMVVWPEFVLASPPEIRELYAFHVTSGGLMRYMPCFCGCTGSGHRNNRDCYVKEVHADGSITFDAMAPT
jgi:hypothetical protein